MDTLRKQRVGVFSALILSLGAYIWFHYFVVRADFDGDIRVARFWEPLGLYLFLFAAYAWSIPKIDLKRDYRPMLGLGLLFRLALVFAIPNLSDDFYRFVWDGRLTNMGINPFDFLPCELWENWGPELRERFSDLWPHLNSQEYYSIYPTPLQTVFAAACKAFPNDAGQAVWVMKFSIFLAEAGSLVLLDRLARRFKLSPRAVLLYAFNPLVIIELSGNLHFEAFMIFFLLLAIHLLSQKKIWHGGAAMALAIASKLLPLMFFPLLIRRLGWKKWFLWCAFSGILGLVILFVFLRPSNLEHFRESINLYFSKFEYNASFYYSLQSIFGDFFWKIKFVLPLLVVATVFYLTWKDKKATWESLPQAMLLALTVYQLTSSTVHPWYLAPLVALSVLTRFRFAILWSFLIFGTYLTYYQGDYLQPWWFIRIEYFILLIYLAYELIFKASGKTLEERVMEIPFLKRMIARSIPARVGIKLDKIAAHMDPKESHLDVGCGNGGLCHSLKAKGYQIQPLDVKNISFFEDVQPLVYDGERFPYEDNSFDTVLIITVLHHTPEPEAILREAQRVARKKIILMEDIYRNPLQKHLTFFMDSLVNFEFDGHPHTNKNDAGWKQTFQEMGLELKSAEYMRTLVFFRQVIYVLET